MSQETSALTTISPEARELICRFESPTNLLATFNPSNQLAYTRDKRRAYLGKAPSLATITQAFKFGTAKSWVAVQLWDLAEFSGCKTKLSPEQIDELAQIVCTEYGFLKLTELMDFFRRFKMGEYGKFYGAVDPMVITCAMREFIADRNAIIDRLRREDEEERRRNDPEHQRWLRQYRERERMCRFYAYNFRSSDFTLEEFSEIWWLFNLGYESKNHGYIE